MNWVEREFLAVAEAHNPDIWVFSQMRQCDHRWQTRPNPVPPIWRGFYRVGLISVCSRCGAEA